MVDDGEARALARAAAVRRVVDAAEVDQHLEAELGTVAQQPQRRQRASGGTTAVTSPSATVTLDELVAERGRQRRGEGFDAGGHQRAIVLVRQILFWSCRMP